MAISLRLRRSTIIGKRIAVFLFLLVFFFAQDAFFPQRTDAALLTTTSIVTYNETPSATSVKYDVTFTFPDTTAIECIQVKFATTSGMGTPATGMTSGSGFTLTGGGLTQGNWTNYGTTNGTLEIYAASGQTPSTSATTITWTGVTNSSITNPSNVFAQITTYTTQSSSGATCSTSVDQSNVMAMIYTTGVTASVSVDPSLSFTVVNYGSAVNGSGDTSPVTTTATTIPFATVAAGSTAWGSQTLTVGTNAAHGYNLYTDFSQSLTDANSDTIRNQACASADCTTAANAQSFDGSNTQSSFAYTADNANVSFGSNKWLGFVTPSTGKAKIASNTGPIASDATHIEYKVEISNAQSPGTYSSVITFIAAPTY